MKHGAFDYLEKPFKVEELKICVQRALSYNAAISETVFLRKQLKKKYHFSQIIGSAQNMQDVFKMIERVAGTDSTILVLGKAARARNWSPGRCTSTARGSSRRLCPSTAAPCRKTCSNRSSSATAAAPSPGRSTTRRGCSRKRMGGRFFSMRSGPCRRCCKAGCCAFCRSARCGASERTPLLCQRPGRGGFQRAAGEKDQGRHVSRGPLLPAERHSHLPAAVA